MVTDVPLTPAPNNLSASHFYDLDSRDVRQIVCRANTKIASSIDPYGRPADGYLMLLRVYDEIFNHGL